VIFDNELSDSTRGKNKFSSVGAPKTQNVDIILRKQGAQCNDFNSLTNNQHDLLDFKVKSISMCLHIEPPYLHRHKLDREFVGESLWVRDGWMDGWMSERGVDAWRDLTGFVTHTSFSLVSARSFRL
jgi:hypothetical protein